MGWASTNKSLILPDKVVCLGPPKKIFLKMRTFFLSGTIIKELKLKKKISFDENFMITVEDEVFNETSEIIELTNFFSYLRRKNYRPENKFFILHEGPLGVFNDTLKEFSYEDIEETGEIIESTKKMVGLVILIIIGK